MTMCKCRECFKIYDEDKATADYKGYCSQACLHSRARRFGYKASLAKKAAYSTHTEYDVLSRVGEIGSVVVTSTRSQK